MAITISDVINVGVGGATAASYYDAAQKALGIGQSNAEIEARQTEEEVRRQSISNRRTEGLARARAAASGVGGASMEMYIESLTNTGLEEVAWMEEVGQTRYQKALDEGESAYDAAMFKFYEATASTITSLV